MGDNIKLLKSWIASAPSKLDANILLQMLKVLVNALGDSDKDAAVLQETVNALEASLSVAETQIANLSARVTMENAEQYARLAALESKVI
jgi:hypothetical protein